MKVEVNKIEPPPKRRKKRYKGYKKDFRRKYKKWRK
jgi:hypothetical protein